jgi:hypothetical protein
MGACGDKKKKKAEEAPADKPVLAAVVGLGAVPASASAVIGLDVSTLATSPLVSRAVERMFAQDTTLEAELSSVFQACKFDPKTDLSAATIALLPQGEQTESLLVAKGKFSESALSACLGRFFSESGGRLEVAEFEGRTLYHQVTQEPGGLWLSFGSKDTLLVSSARPALELALGNGPKLSAAKDGLARFASRTNTKATIWALAHIPEGLAAGLVAATQGQVQPAKSVLGSVNLADGLTLAIEVEMASEEDAKTLISQASIQIQGLALVLQIDAVGPLLKKMQLTTDGHWASLGWKLTEQELADLMSANMSGLSSAIDNDGVNGQKPAPKSELEGEAENGKHDADAGNEKDL